MFTINSYLQFRNTPDGKPRVLNYYKDYNFKDKNGFNCIIANKLFTNYGAFEDNNILADLEDCRLLLTVEFDDFIFTELSILEVEDKIEYSYKYEKKYCILNYDEEAENFSFMTRTLSYYGFHEGYGNNFKEYSFFDDPAKYSKLLWNCSEKKGWDKIFKLLNIIK